MEDDPNAKASLAEEGCIAMLATRRMIDTIDAMVPWGMDLCLVCV